MRSAVLEVYICELSSVGSTRLWRCLFELRLWPTAQLQQQRAARILCSFHEGFLALCIFQKWETAYSLSVHIALKKRCLVGTSDWLFPALPRVSSPASSLLHVFPPEAGRSYSDLLWKAPRATNTTLLSNWIRNSRFVSFNIPPPVQPFHLPAGRAASPNPAFAALKAKNQENTPHLAANRTSHGSMGYWETFDIKTGAVLKEWTERRGEKNSNSFIAWQKRRLAERRGEELAVDKSINSILRRAGSIYQFKNLILQQRTFDCCFLLLTNTSSGVSGI